MEAVQQLLNLEASAYPNMNSSSRRRIDRHYSRIVASSVPVSKVDKEISWKILKAKAPPRAKVK